MDTKAIFPRRQTTGSNDPYEGISMGDQVRDTLSGFTGVVIARSEFLTGCNQVLVMPESHDPSKMNDSHWFDVERMQKIKERAVEFRTRPGGADMPLPTRGNTSQRRD